MDCEKIELNIEPYLDGELTLSDRRDFEEHVSECNQCETKLEALRTVSELINNSTYNKAPTNLKLTIQNQLRDYTGEQSEKFNFIHWFGFGTGAMAFGAFVTWLVMAVLISAPLQSPIELHAALADQIVSSHVRSLMVDHMIDVKSSDRHTVKPWFNGRVDFSPPVKDLNKQGYKLLGGRLDYIQGKAVSALVYQRRAHIINTFIFKNDVRINNLNNKKLSLHRNGYNLFSWKNNGLVYWVVSDLNKKELNDFIRLGFNG